MHKVYKRTGKAKRKIADSDQSAIHQDSEQNNGVDFETLEDLSETKSDEK